MHKIKKIIVISMMSIIFIVGGLFFLSLGSLGSETEDKIITISEYINPNNKYVILFQSVGEPWLFGPAKVKVTLLDDKRKEVDVISDSIKDDGGSATKNSIKVKWFDSYVEVVLFGCEQDDKTYRIDYN